MTDHRVVITGVGIISPLGNSREETWQNVVNGKSGVGKITLFNANEFPCKIAAEVKGFDVIPSLKKRNIKKYISRPTSFALSATNEALEDAGINDKNTDFSRIGTVIGSSGYRPTLNEFKEMFDSYSDNFKDTSFMVESLKNKYHTCSEVVSINNNFQGPTYSISTACASGTQAIGVSAQMIKKGYADVVVSGGCDSMINEIDLMSFCLLGAVTTDFNDCPQKASRPFSKTRSGFVLGEGSAVLILESLEHAKKRHARIYGEVKGYGSTISGYSLTDPPEDGSGALYSMKEALNNSNLNTNDIDYINMHGTSTKDNDYTETLSVKRLFGDKAFNLPVSSTKSTTAHLISGAGALEAAICLLSIRDSVAPPTINLDDVDGQCDLDYIPNKKRNLEIKNALSNSLGFGGSNASIILGRI